MSTIVSKNSSGLLSEDSLITILDNTKSRSKTACKIHPDFQDEVDSLKRLVADLDKVQNKRNLTAKAAFSVYLFQSHEKSNTSEKYSPIKPLEKLTREKLISSLSSSFLSTQNL